VNAGHFWGWTPLHSAAEEGHKDLVELLITKGANVNAKDEDGVTPLQYAKIEGHTGIVELLRKHGAKE
jgi:ankyrin repeat protein